MTEEQVGERRGSDRLSLEGSVCIKVIEQKILGPSRNISTEGIYFIAEARQIDACCEMSGGNEHMGGHAVPFGICEGVVARASEEQHQTRLLHSGLLVW